MPDDTMKKPLGLEVLLNDLATTLKPKSKFNRMLDRLAANAVEISRLRGDSLKLKLVRVTTDGLEKMLTERTKEWEAAVQAVEQKNGELEKLQQENSRLRSHVHELADAGRLILRKGTRRDKQFSQTKLRDTIERIGA